MVRLTRWLGAVTVKDITVETVAYAFVERQVENSGSPPSTTSDRVGPFESETFTVIQCF